MEDVIWKVHSSATITDQGGPTCLPAAGVSCSIENEVPGVSLLDYGVPTSVLLSKP